MKIFYFTEKYGSLKIISDWMGGDVHNFAFDVCTNHRQYKYCQCQNVAVNGSRYRSMIKNLYWPKKYELSLNIMSVVLAWARVKIHQWKDEFNKHFVG